MSSMTLMQIAEKPITAANEEAIRSLVASRLERLPMLLQCHNLNRSRRLLCMRLNHCCGLKWRQRRTNQLTFGCGRAGAEMGRRAGDEMAVWDP
jgi:hypothetical protein